MELNTQKQIRVKWKYSTFLQSLREGCESMTLSLLETNSVASLEYVDSTGSLELAHFENSWISVRALHQQ